MPSKPSNRIKQLHFIKKIHALKNAVGLSEEEYRLTLLSNFKVVSSKELTATQAEELIKELEAEAVRKGTWQRFEGKCRFQDLADRPGMASPAQLRKVEALWKDASRIRDARKRAKALRSFLYGHFKISDLRFLEGGNVRKVVNALNHIIRQKDESGSASDRE